MSLLADFSALAGKGRPTAGMMNGRGGGGGSSMTGGRFGRKGAGAGAGGRAAGRRRRGHTGTGGMKSSRKAIVELMKGKWIT